MRVDKNSYSFIIVLISIIIVMNAFQSIVFGVVVFPKLKSGDVSLNSAKKTVLKISTFLNWTCLFLLILLVLLVHFRVKEDVTTTMTAYGSSV